MIPPALLAVLVVAASASRAPGDLRRELAHALADARQRGEPEPGWKVACRTALRKKVTFEFNDTPLDEGMRFLSELAKVNIVVAPDFPRDHAGAPITLKVTEMSLGKALNWICSMIEADHVLRDEAVAITWRRTSKAVQRTYDVRDITREVSDRLPPHIDLLGMGRLPEPYQEVYSSFKAGCPYDAAALAEQITTLVSPAEWDAAYGTSMETLEGFLVVVQRPEVHREVERFLARVREQRSIQVHVEARLVAVPESVIGKIAGENVPGASTVYLTERQLELLRIAVDDASARLVSACAVSCFNGQKSYAVDGFFRERKPVEEDTVYDFRGTMLVARPLVSFDRRYLLMDIRLWRWEDGEGSAVRTYQFNASARCLDSDTVLVGSAAVPSRDGSPPRRLVALVTPTIRHLEPPERPASLGPATEHSP